MGERLGRYVVLKHLASGGMADVLLARTDGIEGFERHVVLKRIRAEHAKDQRFIDMFLDEARLAANLHHQNVVQVHDIGEADGEYFFAMEYIHGEDLRALLSAVAKTRAHMPLGYVIAIISAAAAGLHHAHERRGADKKPLNIVHRDVSPSNILLGYDGSVKVVDFGIAKAAMRQVETRSGSLKGKVSYMSPEQCKLLAIDRRSDVYALGVVLYELATTTRLFKSDSDYLVMDAICTGKIPAPRVRRPDLPNDLSAIIMKALATDVESRYQTAEELRAELDQFAIKHGLTANAGALATYIHKLFGDKPEPWLESSSADPSVAAGSDATAATDMARRSWTELPRADTSDEAKTTTDGKGKFKVKPVIQGAVEPAGDTVLATEPTNTKLGWQQRPGSHPPAPARGGSAAIKLALIAVPLLAVIGFGAWKLFGGDAPAATPASSPETTPPAVAPTAALTPPPAVEPAVEPAVAVIPPDAAPRAPTGPARPVPAPRDMTVTRKPPPEPAPAKKPPVAKVETAKPAAVDKPVVVARPPEPVVPTPAPAVTPPPTPVTPPPAPVAPAMAVIAPSAVEQVAQSNRRALAACDAGAELKGEVTVRFEVNALGRVVKSQVASSVKNPKVSGCILRTVQSWSFPKPASGSAKGVYTIAYQ